MTHQKLNQLEFRLLPVYFDKVFRLLFDDSQDARILISFLNAVLHLEGDERICSLTLTPREIPGLLPEDKEVILDIQATDQQQRQFSIEMQVNPQGFYRARALYYACGLYHTQLRQGQSYLALKPVYSIHLLCFNLWPEGEVPRIHSIFELRDRFDGRLYSDLLELHVVELEKLPWHSLKPGMLKTLDLESAWLYLIRHGHELPRDVVREAMPPEIQEAYGRLEMVSREPDLQRAYLQYEKAKRDQLAYLPDLMEESRQKGVKEGRAEGRAEGMLVLLERFREQGRISPEEYELEKARLLRHLEP